jgi:hypothetical protein
MHSLMPTPSRVAKATIMLLTVLAVLMSAGCGGGGGSAAAKLRYITDWSNRGRAVTGLSQRISIYGVNGVLVQTVVMNQDSESTQTIEMSGFLKSTYRLYIELFSQRDLGGVKTGEIDTLLTISSTTFRSEVGVDPNSIKVFPPQATWPVQQSRQFYAVAYAGSNAVFTEPNGFTWSTLGGHASINSQGIALGESVGSGSIRATHIASGLQNSAPYTITPTTTTTSKWTVMVFMNAANDLYAFSPLNMNQMERVAQNEQNVRFVVQWKQAFIPGISTNPTFQGTRRYLVKPDQTNGIASQLIQDMGSQVDMGDKQTLQQFIQWAKTYYPAERYCLVIWNHGNGWRRRPGKDEPITRAVSYDDETGNSIQVWELSQAIGQQLDIVSWDASLMQMMEVAYEIKDQAKFVVGSEESPPGEGLPYDLVFDDFRDNPNATTAALSKSFVDGMLAVPGYNNRKITQSVIDTSKLDALATALDTLAGELIANQQAASLWVQQVRNQSQSYRPTTFRVYRDIWDMADRLQFASNIPSLDDACQGVKDALTAAVVWEGHNANSPGSKGLSIDFSSSQTFPQSADDYALLRFAIQTQWDEWLSQAP